MVIQQVNLLLSRRNGSFTSCNTFLCSSYCRFQYCFYYLGFFSKNSYTFLCWCFGPTQASQSGNLLGVGLFRNRSSLILHVGNWFFCGTFCYFFFSHQHSPPFIVIFWFYSIK